MTRNLANAHGIDGVRFNLINPGWILTDREYVDQVKKGMPEGWPQKLGRDNIPFGVMSTPEQLAAACVYWIGDESKPFTGSVVELRAIFNYWKKSGEVNAKAGRIPKGIY
jgi:NAD(P)-dependent dehydrogenase (short-subunit alcohol dehydrogenase family)